MSAPLLLVLPLGTLAGAGVVVLTFAVSHGLIDVIELMPECDPSCGFWVGGLVLARPMTAHVLASAAYRLGIPLRLAIRDDLARAVQQVHPSVEDNLG